MTHVKVTIKKNMKALLLLLTIWFFSNPCLSAERFPAPPDDPRQSITWWKSYRISASEDKQVEDAQKIFQNLLRAWDNSRLEPGLTVVKSAKGPWAASLADGNILLSRDAIDSCMRFGKQRGRHLLAFVLAHELAHQRADDLWHQRFFRMLDKQAEEPTRQAVQSLQLDEKTIASMQQKEAQADHDGLILMASVGYDPYQIMHKQDFFTAWVENIWGESCADNRSENGIHQACDEARGRALRTRAQLGSLATQTMLYELGVQAFVAKNYVKAREYFSAYARDYPGRAVLSALGLSYLAEAVAAHNKLIALGAIKQPAFYYPLMLDASSDAAPGELRPGLNSRSTSQAMIKKLTGEKKSALQNSIKLFEKTIRLAPEHRKSYLLLATAYLLDGNSYMVRGVLQGRYQPKFSNDAAVDLLLAMTQALEGVATKDRVLQSEQAFTQLLNHLDKMQKNRLKNTGAMSENLLIYSSYFNYAALLNFSGKPDRVKKYWKQLAQAAKKSGNSLLFRLALNQLNLTSLSLAELSQIKLSQMKLSQAPTINGYRLGDINLGVTNQADELWIDGELHRVYRLPNGSHLITGSEGKIISASQQMGQSQEQVTIDDIISLGDSADRPFKTLGIPDRRLLLSSGEYLAYDNYGLALHLNNNKVQGWFLYKP